MTPAARMAAALVALSLAAWIGAARAQPLRAPPATQAAMREAAKAQVSEALTLYDARRLIRLPDGSFERPQGASEADARRARELLLSAAYAGSAEARDYAGRMAQAGAGGPRDLPRARKLYEDAATRAARWRLAGMLERGEGGPNDSVSARGLYKLASTQGQLDARYDFARMARRGQGGKPDPAAALKALTSMSAVAHADAAAELADMLDKGEGGKRDPKAAAEQHLRALESASRFYAPPPVLARWSAISAQTRAEIGKLLRARGLADAPLDGAAPPPGWDKRYLAARKGETPPVHNAR